MAIVYRVWIQLERHDTTTDQYTEELLDFASTAMFEGKGAERKARRFADKLNDLANTIPEAGGSVQ